ncbi:MAG: hypothetical protein ACRDGT_04540 [Candidatus Limnocylindria bacterium]
MTRAALSVAVVAPFVILILVWALGLIPTLALLPLLTAPLAMRLGDNVADRADIVRGTLVFAALFIVLLAAGIWLPLV